MSGSHRPAHQRIWGLITTSLALMFVLLAAAYLKGASSTEASAGAEDRESAPDLEVWLTAYATVPFNPVEIANSGVPGDGRLFVVSQDGRIWITEPGGTTLPDPFLDITGRVTGTGEMGLLGLAFDPDYDTNGYFYVNYTHTDDVLGLMTRISRFAVTADPNHADPNSELIIFTVEQPYNNHNAGDLSFGPDSYLYFGLGDGGSAGDPQNRAQNLLVPLGKMLRIDVSGTTSTTNYLIPPDNPYVGDPFALDEIWHSGLRNPWRFSFDRQTGDMYIGDVGQNLYEEIDFQPAGSPGGENWGWRCYEGFNPYNTSGCGPFEDYDPPIFEYAHATAPGCSVTGGFVYRGQEFPSINGVYLLVDWCFGTFWGLRRTPLNQWEVVISDSFTPGQFTSFGEDINGELYLASTYDNTIYKINAAHYTETQYVPILSGG